MAWSQVLAMPRVAITISPLSTSGWVEVQEQGHLGHAAKQHLLVLAPSWGCGGRLLCQEPNSWEQQGDPGPPVSPHTSAGFLAPFLQCGSALRLSIPSRQ